MRIIKLVTYPDILTLYQQTTFSNHSNYSHTSNPLVPIMKFASTAGAVISLIATARCATIGYLPPVNSTLLARDSHEGVGCDDIMLSKSETDDATNDFFSQCNGVTQSIFVYSGDTVRSSLGNMITTLSSAD